jgi:hypothetical protein
MDAANRTPSPADPPPDAFRWRAWFQRSADPLFVLSRTRRVLFVNRAWQELTGVPLDRARQLALRRKRPVSADAEWETILEHVLRPPDEVLDGRPGRVRRAVPRAAPERRWWEIDFLPFRGDAGVLFVLGRVIPTVVTDAPSPLPPGALALRAARAARYGLDALAGELPAVRLAAEQLRLAARVRVPVLLVGAKGTGKAWAARAVHESGPDRGRPFVALDCARLPAAAVAGVLLGEGELAQRCDAGTVYLHEPARLPRELQLRLCRLLDAGDGEAAPRVLAGVRVDPAAPGSMLEDLACRLGTLVVRLPALQERREDLPHLVERLLEPASAATGRRVPGVTPPAWEALRAHAWPGNLAELYAVLVSACERAGEQIDAADLPLYLRRDRRSPPAEERPLPLKQLLEGAERRLIELALRRGGNRSRAAELLQVWRPLLLRRMKALGIAEPGPRKKKRPPEAAS